MRTEQQFHHYKWNSSLAPPNANVWQIINHKVHYFWKQTLKRILVHTLDSVWTLHSIYWNAEISPQAITSLMALEKKVLLVMAWNTCKTKAFVQFFFEHFQVEKYIIKTQRCCHVYLSAFDTVRDRRPS